MSQYFFQTIRARVRNPFLPVDISTRLPLHLSRVVGVQCRYCTGLERIVPFIQAETISRIGWFSLCVNNQKRPLGVFDVRYERTWIDANQYYQEIDVPIQKGSMITGTYNNELKYPYGNLANKSGGSLINNTPVSITNPVTGTIAATYDGLFFETPKINPEDIQIVNPTQASNYDGYIVAIYLKCLGEPAFAK